MIQASKGITSSYASSKAAFDVAGGIGEKVLKVAIKGIHISIYL
jgi:hypothetical protein